MKTHLLGMLCFCFACMAAQAQYFYGYAVYFNSAGKGFIIGDSGSVYTAPNAGASWTKQQVLDFGSPGVSKNASLSGIHFPTPQVGYAVGWATLLKTTDGGATWTEPHHLTEILSRVHFVSEDVGMALGIGIILRTVDGGKSWDSQYHYTNPATGGLMTYQDVYFPSPSAGYIVGLDGWIRKTTDQGASWDSLPSATREDLRAVHFPTEAVGYAVGDKGTIVKTTNGGSSWAVLPSGTTGTLRAVFFVDANTGWAVGGDLTPGEILKTTNGGAAWKPVTQKLYGELESVFFTDASTGYAVGLGLWLKTTDGGTSWQNAVPGAAIQPGLAYRSSLRAERGTLHFDLARPALVQARILDSRGRLIQWLTDGNLEVGSHALALPASGTSSVSLLDFRSGSSRQTLLLAPY
jgi:photosystem II stability/assembly factor-like uncharacterized protein